MGIEHSYPARPAAGPRPRRIDPPRARFVPRPGLARHEHGSVRVSRSPAIPESLVRHPVRPLAVTSLIGATLVASLVATACFRGLPSEPPIPPTGGRRVLFVGNSLTYTFDIPGIVADFAESLGETPLVYKTVAFPNFALEDHWYTGIAESIEPHDWDLVVMQQGPSSLAASAEHLRIWTVKLDSVAKAHGARSALYQVWPSNQYLGSFTAVRESYRNAALAVDGMFIPAGEAWRAAWQEDAGFALYGSDGFHPSALGAYLAALVHFEMIYGRPATDLPNIARVGGLTIDLPPAKVAQLQRVAHETVVAWGIP